MDRHPMESKRLAFPHELASVDGTVAKLDENPLHRPGDFWGCGFPDLGIVGFRDQFLQKMQNVRQPKTVREKRGSDGQNVRM